MKFFNIARRISLFIAVNLLVVLTISLVINFVLPQFGIELRGTSMATLLTFCFVWGMGGAFLSLMLSRFMAKWMMGVKVIKQPQSGMETTKMDELTPLLNWMIVWSSCAKSAGNSSGRYPLN